MVNDEFLGRPNKIEKRSFRFYLPNLCLFMTFSRPRDTISTLGVFSTPGRCHKCTGGCHDKCGGRSLGKQLNLYGNPGVLNIPWYTHGISMCTAQTLCRVILNSNFSNHAQSVFFLIFSSSSKMYIMFSFMPFSFDHRRPTWWYVIGRLGGGGVVHSLFHTPQRSDYHFSWKFLTVL